MEVMIDIETLDTKASAVVYEVGAVFFKGTKQFKYLWRLDVPVQVARGRTISGDTMKFHFGHVQGKNLLTALTDPKILSMPCFIHELIEAVQQHKPEKFWAKGNFDYPILEDLFDLFCTKVPWKYYQLGELRTLMKECGVDKGKVQHTAAADCVDQIKRLKACRAIIRKGKA